MKNRNLNILSIFLCLCFSIFCSTINAKGQETPIRIVVHETSLRKKATKIVVPRYPREAVKAEAAGVAVSEITVSENGSVINVKVLESPHKSVSASVIEALKQWEFSLYTIKGKPQKVTGKITYYFVIEGKNAKVESPYEKITK